MRTAFGIVVLMFAVVCDCRNGQAEELSFDFMENRGAYNIQGPYGERFATKWSTCDDDSIYAYSDNVQLVGVGASFKTFPVSADAFVGLDWEQRAPVVHEGEFVVFLNADNQFLCVRVDDVKVKSRGDDEDLLAIEYKVYGKDVDSANAILRAHNDKGAEYVLMGADTGVGTFRYVANNGRLTVCGKGGQRFETKWSARSGESVYAYRDYVGRVSLPQKWMGFPDTSRSFVNLDWTQRATTVSEGEYVVFMNASNQYLCVHVTEVLSKSRGDSEDLVRFEYKAYRPSNWLEDGVASFDHTIANGNFAIVGTQGQLFKTSWSWADQDTMYAYRDYVQLVAPGRSWASMPESATEFLDLDWEQREAEVDEGGYVVFLNDANQFLCVKVKDVLVRDRGDAKNWLTIDYRMYEADEEIATKILRLHESKKADYVVSGQNQGSASFRFDANAGHFTVIGANDEKFVTMWTECGADTIYAYRDYVRLIGVSSSLTSFPLTVKEFERLDWEQRAPTIREGGYVVFMNEQGQFLCVHVKDIKVKSRGDSENRIDFDYQIYAADGGTADDIARDHNEKAIDYEMNGKDIGVVSFRFDANNGLYTITGAKGERFITMWSECGSDSIYAYRDEVRSIGVGADWTEFPVSSQDFVELDWEMRAATVKEGQCVVFRNEAGQFLCAFIRDVKVKSRGDSENLLTFDFKIYGKESAVSDIIDLNEDSTSGVLEDTVKVDVSEDGKVAIPSGIDPSVLKIKLIKYIRQGGHIRRIDVSELMSLPKTEDGLLDLSKATVKPEILAEILNVELGAKINLDPANVCIETVKTREGLTYEFFEADTLEGLNSTAKESKLGDGTSFRPYIKPSGSKARFFKIGIRK